MTNLRLGVDGAALVNGLTNDVDDATKGLITDGDLDGRASVEHGLTTDQTLSTVHGNGADLREMCRREHMSVSPAGVTSSG